MNSTDGPVAWCPRHGFYSVHTGCFGCYGELPDYPTRADCEAKYRQFVPANGRHGIRATVAPTASTKQSYADSAIEVAVNIAIGATISLASQEIIFPLYGIHVGTGTHLGIVAAFTVVSIARQYVIRRICNGRSPWMAIKGRFQGRFS